MNFNHPSASHPVIFVKSGKISEYGGTKSITTAGGTTVTINPKLPEVRFLRNWFDAARGGYQAI